MDHFKRRLRVAHIIPSLGVGGVEVGIAKSYSELSQHFDYQLFYVKSPGKLKFKQCSVLKLLIRTALKQWQVDIVVTSLWAAHPFGFIFQRMGVKWIAFYHSGGIVHWLESLIFSIAWKRADMRMVDSRNCGLVMTQLFGDRSWRVVNYYFPVADKAKPWRSRNFDISFVGRSDPVKRLDLVAKLVQQYAELRPDFRAIFILSGPSPRFLINFAKRYPTGVLIRNDVANSTVHKILADSRFFVLMSDVEGFSMATAEAVMACAIPVVRPVGEIGSYVSSESGIIISDVSSSELRKAAERMVSLASQENYANKMTQVGRAYLSTRHESYCDSFLRCIEEFALN